MTWVATGGTSKACLIPNYLLAGMRSHAGVSYPLESFLYAKEFA